MMELRDDSDCPQPINHPITPPKGRDTHKKHAYRKDGPGSRQRTSNINAGVGCSHAVGIGG